MGVGEQHLSESILYLVRQDHGHVVDCFNVQSGVEIFAKNTWEKKLFAIREGSV